MKKKTLRQALEQEFGVDDVKLGTVIIHLDAFGEAFNAAAQKAIEAMKEESIHPLQAAQLIDGYACGAIKRLAHKLSQPKEYICPDCRAPVDMPSGQCTRCDWQAVFPKGTV